jgi:hypothetical protein
MTNDELFDIPAFGNPHLGLSHSPTDSRSSPQSSLNPVPRNLLLFPVGVPNVFSPVLHEFSVLFNIASCPQVSHRQLPTKARRFWLGDLRGAVQPFLYGSISAGIAILFKPAAEAGEVRGVGLGRTAV